MMKRRNDHPSAGLVETAGILQMARALRVRGEHRAALDVLLRSKLAFREDPMWAREVAEAALSCGDTAAANRASEEMIASAINDPSLMKAALAVSEDRLPEAEPTLRARLRQYPADVVAIRLMAELATRLGRMDDAERLLRRALVLAPSYGAARELLARNLQRSNQPEDALAEVVHLLEMEPDNPSHMLLKASLLVKTGDQIGARDVYKRIVAKHPTQAKAWMSLGHALKTLGEQSEGIAAYRRALVEQSTLGEVWWSLANLKTIVFSDVDLSSMEAALAAAADGSNGDEDRLHLHFALGKAREDRAEYDAAFDHWQAGNAIRRRSLPYSTDDTHAECVAAKILFDNARLAGGTGVAAAEPIFIVGLPRAGSTLIEQILASHSQIEGTMELPDIMAMAARLRGNGDAKSYAETIRSLSPSQLSELGEEYLSRTRIHRREGRPFFIDKMPNNWLHVGLIRAILPNARIIDARRNAADCCLSAFKQHFARGQGFSYDLEDLGRYYRDYVDLMDHFDSVAPGMIHRAQYETMVSDTEGEVRRLLDYCNLAFEPGCLSFWQNDRAVRTASSEQVRQPIFANGVGHWRHFAPRLEKLFSALGPALSPV
jgi:tetratricopeptide (TPR) repeat protein